MTKVPEAGAVHLGAVLADAWYLIRHLFVQQLAAGLLLMLPLIGLIALLNGGLSVLTDAESIGYWVYSVLAPAVLWGAVGTFCTTGNLALLDGTPLSVGDTLRQSLKYCLPILVAEIVLTIAAGIGMILLVVPYFIVVGFTMVVMPVIVADRRGPLAALKRSGQMIRGNFWRALALALLYMVPYLVLEELLWYQIPDPEPFWYAIGTFGMSATTAVVATAFSASLYQHLQAAWSGDSHAEIEQVFE
ncbi:MAG: hypothetical protein EP335_07760 [Alphaproteobacteria bacterium]|nr:MAG: hypothetical protein EP335_07760 [Alphaproteobacteria bacterium]